MTHAASRANPSKGHFIKGKSSRCFPHKLDDGASILFIVSNPYPLEPDTPPALDCSPSGGFPNKLSRLWMPRVPVLGPVVRPSSFPNSLFIAWRQHGRCLIESFLRSFRSTACRTDGYKCCREITPHTGAGSRELSGMIARLRLVNSERV